MKSIAILGSTGSIGCSTLDVIARHPDRFRPALLTARRDDATLLEQVQRFTPPFVAMVDVAAAARIRPQLPPGTTLFVGEEGLIAAVEACGAQMMVAAIVGGAGLRPTLKGVECGMDIALANKECLVMAGPVFMNAVRQAGVRLLPVDSEHSAIFQCLAGQPREAVASVMLTASGGPFRHTPKQALADITPEQAVRHPNWSMGRKISVDSATLINKGLEVIEARWLFDLNPDQIEVTIHPSSVVHSFVKFVDGSVMAQIGHPDMRAPIALALAWPQRIASGVAPLDPSGSEPWVFEAPDVERFPGLQLCFDALRGPASATTVLNAANEVAVEAFLERQIPFTAIAAVVGETLSRFAHHERLESLEEVLAVDAQARRVATECLADHPLPVAAPPASI